MGDSIREKIAAGVVTRKEIFIVTKVKAIFMFTYIRVGKLIYGVYI